MNEFLYDINKLKKTQSKINEDFTDLITRMNMLDSNQINKKDFVEENNYLIKYLFAKMFLIKDNMSFLNKEDIYKLNTLLNTMNDIIKNIAL